MWDAQVGQRRCRLFVPRRVLSDGSQAHAVAELAGRMRRLFRNFRNRVVLAMAVNQGPTTATRGHPVGKRDGYDLQRLPRQSCKKKDSLRSEAARVRGCSDQTSMTAMIRWLRSTMMI